ncbi:MAG: osmoprotectant transport system permease protein [Actinomycetota bacterium]|nr:osmoprotectant transport system permease protein [Actinomycetota bacterium]
MSLLAVVTALVLALPVGLVLGHLRRGGVLAVNISNVGRAVPSFAILVIGAQLFGIGAKPAFAALVALAIPPVMTNTYVGMTSVDPDIVEAGRGMGMTAGQMLLRVELPVAFPLIMAGVRTSAVNVVATASLAALVAWGGLGRYIVDGLAQQNKPMLFVGAVLVALLSVLTELGLALLQRAFTSPGLRGEASKVDLAPVAGAATAPTA